MISVATPADRTPIVRTLVAAFSSDPVLRHIFPDQEEYEHGAAAFFGHVFDKRVGMGAIWTVEGGVSVAIWEPPGTPPASSPLELPEPAASRLRAYDEVVHAAFPESSYWYLGVLGTHPDHTGRGLGRAVMQAGLQRAAEAGLPAYLETATRRNVALYERSGWKVVAEIDEPVPTWVMQQ
ncbi:GNAT family N-acetyltransferase [Kineosporia rhizophila]|uniref:GNAT family N-acetyltransferase n=1 Tax=Kineosporia rhizophila TaxID=84633 RepID=UPI001E5D3C0B|nr:GNAT family N-acetyltransferase [Kineosporia rhizophila]